MKYKLLILPIAMTLIFQGVVCAEGRSTRHSMVTEGSLEKRYENESVELNLESVTRNGFVEKLREEFAGYLAGIYREYKPVHKFVVRLKGDIEIEDRIFNMDGKITLVEFIVNQPHTSDELQKIIDSYYTDLAVSIENMQGVFVDERTGEIVIDVYMKVDDYQIEGELKNVAENILGYPVRINVLRAKLKNSGIVRGGVSMALGCTTGFVVKKTGSSIYGITTADHCPNGPATLTDPNGGGNTLLTYQEEAYSASVDLQWYTSNINYGGLKAQWKPEFYGEYLNTPTVLKGKQSQSDTSIGDTVCHRGKTTGYSCGKVSSKKYKPSVCGAQVCASTWVAVEPSTEVQPTLACAEGDSGGPWFTDTEKLALGTLQTISAFEEIGLCFRAVYMSVDKFDTLGLELIYGS